MTSKRKNNRQLPTVTDDAYPVELLTMVAEQMQKTMPVTQGGETVYLKTFEVLFQKTLQTGFRGSPHSQRLAIDLMAQADSFQQHELSEKIAAAKTYKRTRHIEFERAVDEGKDTRLILPHPDDVVIDSHIGLKFIGPIDETELRDVEANVRLLNTLLIQDALDQRLLTPGPGDEFVITVATVLIDLINNTLPHRFRVSDADLMMRLEKLNTRTKRELLTLAYQNWTQIGYPQKRGFAFPLYTDVAIRFEAIMELVGKIKKSVTNGETIKSIEIQEWIQSNM